MYHTIVLAYDGSLGGRRALREGAEVAIKFGSATHLLAVMKPAFGTQIGHGFDIGHMTDTELKHYSDTLDEGVAMLKGWGLEATGHLVRGDPVAEISRLAAEVAADLVVVGHGSHGALARWWRTPLSASLLDKLECSLLIAMREPAAGG
ncbi:MAG TPA: universal stress protein [Gammaproteobacteria bacterium]|jgi:nucleotide-binding universal stress UspA family protein|nr:universal stress protein [Gammaproteobacteria bacterium]